MEDVLKEENATTILAFEKLSDLKVIFVNSLPASF